MSHNDLQLLGRKFVIHEIMNNQKKFHQVFDLLIPYLIAKARGTLIVLLQTSKSFKTFDVLEFPIDSHQFQ